MRIALPMSSEDLPELQRVPIFRLFLPAAHLTNKSVRHILIVEDSAVPYRRSAGLSSSKWVSVVGKPETGCAVRGAAGDDLSLHKGRGL